MNFVNIPFDNLPDRLYHATTSDRLQSIQEHGLGFFQEHERRYDYDGYYLGDITEGIFLANSALMAYDVMDSCRSLCKANTERRKAGEPLPEIIVMEVRKEYLNKGNVYIDPNFTEPGDGDVSYFYDGTIDASYLRIVILPPYPDEDNPDTLEKEDDDTIGEIIYENNIASGVVVCNATENHPRLIMSLFPFDEHGNQCVEEQYLTWEEATHGAAAFHTPNTEVGDWMLPNIYMLQHIGAKQCTRSARFCIIRNRINLALYKALGTKAVMLRNGLHLWSSTPYLNAEKGKWTLLTDSGGIAFFDNACTNGVRAFRWEVGLSSQDTDLTKNDSSDDRLWKVEQFFGSVQGKVTCICGDTGSGKSTLAKRLRNENTIVLDGDGVRAIINDDLPYNEDGRFVNNTRLAKIAEYLALQGHDVIISTIRADISYSYLKDKLKNVELINMNNYN